jgi:hypothetical protein
MSYVNGMAQLQTYKKLVTFYFLYPPQAHEGKERCKEGPDLLPLMPLRQLCSTPLDPTHHDNRSPPSPTRTHWQLLPVEGTRHLVARPPVRED